MNTTVIDNIRTSLLATRANLAAWLRSTPAAERRARLGPGGEQALQHHLEVIDAATREAEAGTLGTCEVCHEKVETALLEMDYTACVCLAHLSDAEQRKLESELELAASVQRSLLPQGVPGSPYLQIAAYSRPAQIIGGDYFNFYTFPNGSEGLAIADVAGHGVAASLHMAGVHALLGSLTATHNSPGDVVAQVDRLFVHNATFTTFVTLFLAAYDPATHTLSYCNAGHNAPLLLTCGSEDTWEDRWLRPTAAAVGLVEQSTFRMAEVQVKVGDILLLYTDGVTEANNGAGEEWGDNRLAATVEQVADRSAPEILAAIRAELDRWIAGQPLEDDATLVVCKIIG